MGSSDCDGVKYAICAAFGPRVLLALRIVSHPENGSYERAVAGDGCTRQWNSQHAVHAVVSDVCLCTTRCATRKTQFYAAGVEAVDEPSSAARSHASHPAPAWRRGHPRRAVMHCNTRRQSHVQVHRQQETDALRQHACQLRQQPQTGKVGLQKNQVEQKTQSESK